MSAILQFWVAAMLQVCKQTYLFIALDLAISDLKLQKHRGAMENLLLTLLQSKFEQILKESGKGQDGKKGVKSLTANQVLESQFPLGDEEENNMKYHSVLYNLQFSKTMQESFKVNKSQVCLLECFSDQNTKNKQKTTKKPSTVMPNEPKRRPGAMPILTQEQKLKALKQLKTTFAEIRQRYAIRQKAKEKELKQLKQKMKKEYREKRERQRSYSFNRVAQKRKKDY